MLISLQPYNLCDIEEATGVVVSKEDEISQKVEIQLKDPDKEVSEAQAGTMVEN